MTTPIPPFPVVALVGIQQAAQRARCVCGHTRGEHAGKYHDCAGRCLCDICPDGTRNDCWCAGFKPEADE